MNNLNTFLDFMELIWKKDSKIFESFVISNNQAISRIFESEFRAFRFVFVYTRLSSAIKSAIMPDQSSNIIPKMCNFEQKYML